MKKRKGRACWLLTEKAKTRMQATQFKKEGTGSLLVGYPLEQVQQSKALEVITKTTETSYGIVIQIQKAHRKSA